MIALLLSAVQAAALPAEDDYYRIHTIPIPDDIVLEVGGIEVLPDGRPMVSTRRGQVWIVEDAFADGGANASFHLYAEGLQEPLGLLAHEGWIYVAQRGELSRMRDIDGDDLVDEVETVCDAWRVSGNYHEYNFGPRIDHEGNFWITTNKPFGGEPFGRVPWRGFAMRITPEGEMIPTCSGLRSPAGIEVAPWGDAFYTDNQGEWCGASKLSHLDPGTYHGHPHGVFSCELPEWPYPHPGQSPNGMLMPLVQDELPDFRLPAVWFPYEKMGKSPSGMAWDQSGGSFGPFDGQLFVADQHHASVMRVALEQVEGTWQGAAFPFRYGFQCGIIRIKFAPDGSLLVGMSNRGWGGRGNSPFGFQRLEWTGEHPFEMLSMTAASDGFDLVFTDPVDPASASALESWRMESYTYELHAAYGSAEMDRATPTITSVTVAEDGRSAHLVVDGLRAGYVHELHAEGVRSAEGAPLLHDEAYYTLVRIPGGGAPSEE